MSKKKHSGNSVVLSFTDWAFTGKSACFRCRERVDNTFPCCCWERCSVMLGSTGEAVTTVNKRCSGSAHQILIPNFASLFWLVKRRAAATKLWVPKLARNEVKRKPRHWDSTCLSRLPARAVWTLSNTSNLSTNKINLFDCWVCLLCFESWCCNKGCKHNSGVELNWTVQAGVGECCFLPV